MRYQKKGSRYTVVSHDSRMSHIGTGRSACAFRIQNSQAVIKVYYPDSSQLAAEEAAIYSKLESVSSFPALHDSGPNYIVIDFIEGRTFFQCLTGGEKIDTKTIMDVDRALMHVKELQLNPSDIHLHNLILTPEGAVRIIDLARFNQTKNCSQWDDLKAAYHKFYSKRLFPKRMPALLLESIRALYKRNFFHI
ncbi:protein kinase family protein [Bacillus luteus]|uniref:Protein kinase family protein n=1 Tax=Alkalicoccus luteus TaxID=1237094 RepID=A0A969TTQ8_9BACI|nr:protein kinase family protein [Alkalicoccus luteus]